LIQSFCTWLGNTPLSMAIQDRYWVIPMVQTVHILAISVVMASMVMLDLRLLRVLGRTQSIPEVAHRFLPWVWSAVLVLLASGTILIIGEPGRELLSQVFWLKMTLLACALVVTAAFQYALKRRAEFWERRRAVAGVTAIASLMLWVGILAAGRWIAYVEHG